MEAGIHFGEPTPEPYHLIICSAPDEPSLKKLVGDVREKDIRCVEFFEPDLGGSLTAFATEPLDLQRKKVLSWLPLWKHKTS